MATVSKYASYHTAITTGYTNPSNAYADDGVYATAAPAKNAEVSAYWGFAGFSTSEIPDGSVINSVTIEHEYKVSTTASIATEYYQIFKGTTGLGSEQSDDSEPTSDTVVYHQITSGISLSDLRTDDYIRLRTRSRRGNSDTAVTFYIDYVKITVDYSEPVTAYTTTALTSNLQKAILSTTALTSLLEKPARSLTAIKSDLEKFLQDTLALKTVLSQLQYSDWSEIRQYTVYESGRIITALLALLEKYNQQIIALNTELEKYQLSSTALQSLFEKQVISTTALSTLLEQAGSVATALQSILEKINVSQVAVSAELQNQLQTTCGLWTDLEEAIPYGLSTIGLYSTLESISQELVALSVSLETFQSELVALKTDLEKSDITATALASVLEKTTKFCSAIYSQLEGVATSLVGVFALLEKLKATTTALYTTLQKYNTEIVALITQLESVAKDSIALVSALEKYSSDFLAIHSQLETIAQTATALSAQLNQLEWFRWSEYWKYYVGVILKTVLAISADLEPTPRSTVALYTRLYKPKKVFLLDNLDKFKFSLSKIEKITSQLDNLDKYQSSLSKISKKSGLLDNLDKNRSSLTDIFKPI